MNHTSKLKEGMCLWKIQVMQKISRGYTLNEVDKECDRCNGYRNKQTCKDYNGLTARERIGTR